MKSVSVIPVFIPEKACPFRCIYCNQASITQQSHEADLFEIKDKIEHYLQTIPENREKRIAFFGGNFTGIPLDEQNRYLALAKTYLDSGQISGIQLSTRPDYISERIIENLKNKGVTIIELGVQSFFDDVLAASCRGSTVEDIYTASEIIRRFEIDLGLQMMVGLPGDTKYKAEITAQKIAELQAKYARIYPVLVIKDTVLEEWCHTGRYRPLSLEEAIDWCKKPLKYLMEHNVTVLKCGLHPSEGFVRGKDLIAGPFHASFRELVMTEIWYDIFMKAIENKKDKLNKMLEIVISKDNVNFAIGFQKKNRERLELLYENVVFSVEDTLSFFQYRIEEKVYDQATKYR